MGQPQNHNESESKMKANYFLKADISNTHSHSDKQGASVTKCA